MFLIFVTIVMVNLLIAYVSDSFSRVKVREVVVGGGRGAHMPSTCCVACGLILFGSFIVT